MELKRTNAPWPWRAILCGVLWLSAPAARAHCPAVSLPDVDGMVLVDETRFQTEEFKRLCSVAMPWCQRAWVPSSPAEKVVLLIGSHPLDASTVGAATRQAFVDAVGGFAEMLKPQYRKYGGQVTQQIHADGDPIWAHVRAKYTENNESFADERWFFFHPPACRFDLTLTGDAADVERVVPRLQRTLDFVRKELARQYPGGISFGGNGDGSKSAPPGLWKGFPLLLLIWCLGLAGAVWGIRLLRQRGWAWQPDPFRWRLGLLSTLILTVDGFLLRAAWRCLQQGIDCPGTSTDLSFAPFGILSIAMLITGCSIRRGDWNAAVAAAFALQQILLAVVTAARGGDFSQVGVNVVVAAVVLSWLVRFRRESQPGL